MEEELRKTTIVSLYFHLVKKSTYFTLNVSRIFSAGLIWCLRSLRRLERPHSVCLSVWRLPVERAICQNMSIEFTGQNICNTILTNGFLLKNKKRKKEGLSFTMAFYLGKNCMKAITHLIESYQMPSSLWVVKDEDHKYTWIVTAYGLTKHLKIIYVYKAYISEFLCLHYVVIQYWYIISYQNQFGGIFLQLYKRNNAIMTARKGYSLTDSMSKIHFWCDINMWVLNFIKEKPFGFSHFCTRCLIQGNFLKIKLNLLFFFQLSNFQKSTTC